MLSDWKLDDKDIIIES